MLYRALADLVLVVHLGFIVFAVAGGLLALKWRWVPCVHLPAVAWGLYVELSGSVCPLTPLENSFRRAAGESGYSGGFLEHYAVPIIYPPGLTPTLQFVLAGVLALANVIAYGLVIRRRMHERQR